MLNHSHFITSLKNLGAEVLVPLGHPVLVCPVMNKGHPVLVCPVMNTEFKQRYLAVPFSI